MLEPCRSRMRRCRSVYCLYYYYQALLRRHICELNNLNLIYLFGLLTFSPFSAISTCSLHWFVFRTLTCKQYSIIYSFEMRLSPSACAMCVCCVNREFLHRLRMSRAPLISCRVWVFTAHRNSVMNSNCRDRLVCVVHECATMWIPFNIVIKRNSPKAEFFSSFSV